MLPFLQIISRCSSLRLEQTLSLPLPSAIKMASTKVDNRGSFGSKRSRNDVPRSDGDWTCPQCGNVNFSFRTECNRQNCHAARPSGSPIRGTPPVPGAFGHPASPYFGGARAPPLLPYGMASGYRGPFSGVRYDYGLHSSIPGPYGLLSAYGQPGPREGMGYGPGPVMDRYGFAFRGSPIPMPGQWTEGAPDNSASRKRRGGPDGLHEGDWTCPKCENINFAFRTICNMKRCGTPRPLPAQHRTTSGNKDHSVAPEGSWTCNRCNNLNYPFRTVCNRKGCGNENSATSY